MIDISRINLGELDNENLERVKLMLDISKIQQDITESQATVKKIHQDVEESRATVEQMRIENDKYRAEAKKIEKEAKLYPFVTLGSAMIGGLVVFVLTKLFP